MCVCVSACMACMSVCLYVLCILVMKNVILESVDLFTDQSVFNPRTKFVESKVLSAAPFHDIKPIVLRDLNPNEHIYIYIYIYIYINTCIKNDIDHMSKGQYPRPCADLLHCKWFHSSI